MSAVRRCAPQRTLSIKQIRHCQISRFVVLQHSAIYCVNCLSYFRNSCGCLRNRSKYFFVVEPRSCSIVCKKNKQILKEIMDFLLLILSKFYPDMFRHLVAILTGHTGRVIIRTRPLNRTPLG
jgi:hypothetical protein